MTWISPYNHDPRPNGQHKGSPVRVSHGRDFSRTGGFGISHGSNVRKSVNLEAPKTRFPILALSEYPAAKNRSGSVLSDPPILWCEKANFLIYDDHSEVLVSPLITSLPDDQKYHSFRAYPTVFRSTFFWSPRRRNVFCIQNTGGISDLPKI